MIIVDFYVVWCVVVSFFCGEGRGRLFVDFFRIFVFFFRGVGRSGLFILCFS